MKGEIVTATREHAIEVAANMRTLDCQEIRKRVGLSPEAYVLRSFDHSLHAWAGVIDERTVCVFGLMSRSIISQVATAWLFTTPEIEQHKKAFWRGSIEAVRQMNALYPKLEAFCDARFIRSVQWLRRLGFTVHDEPFEVMGVSFRYCAKGL